MNRCLGYSIITPVVQHSLSRALVGQRTLIGTALKKGLESIAVMPAGRTTNYGLDVNTKKYHKWHETTNPQGVRSFLRHLCGGSGKSPCPRF